MIPRALVRNHCYLMSHLIGSIFNDDDSLYFDPQIDAKFKNGKNYKVKENDERD